MPSDISNKGENTQSFGTNDQLISDFSLTRNLEGDQTERGTITYTQKGTYEAVSSMIPILGSTSQYFKNGAVLQSYTISAEPSNAWKIVLTYYNPSTASTDLVDAGGVSEKDCTLSVSTETRSILLHPNFFDTSSNESKINQPFLYYLNKLVNGGAGTDLVYPPKDSEGSDDLSGSGENNDTDQTRLDASAEKIPIAQAMEQGEPNAAAQACYKLVNQGITSYLVPHVVWNEVSYSSAKPSSVSGVGKIASPSNAPNVGSGNWLLTEYNAQLSHNSEYWQITKVYTHSDEGGSWNTQVYGSGGNGND